MSQSMMHILVCTDFSASSDLAVSHAVNLATRLRARLHLCHIAQNGGLVAATNLGLNIPDEFPAAQQARRRLQHELAGLGADIDAQVHVRMGKPVEGILSMISELRPDLVVVCSHGKGLFMRTLLGSVSQQLTLRSPVPVLIVPAPSRKLLITYPEHAKEAELPSVGFSLGAGGTEVGATGVGVSSVGGADITYR